MTLSQIASLAKLHFGNWKTTSSVTFKIPDPKPTKEMHTVLVERANSPQTLIVLGQPVATQKDKSLAALEVLQSILAGQPTSRLDENLREAKGWTYGVASGVSPLRGKGPMIVSTSIRVPHGADAIHEILTEFERLRTTPVSDQEIHSAVNGLLNSFAARFSTVGKIANVVANQFVYDLPANRDEILYDDIAKVTKEELQRVANRVLKKEYMTAVAVGDLDAILKPISGMNVGKVSVERDAATVNQ